LEASSSRVFIKELFGKSLDPEINLSLQKIRTRVRNFSFVEVTFFYDFLCTIGIHYFRWHRITIPVSVAALATSTIFRWTSDSENVTSRWAIDDVYIGSDGKCPNMCSGTGSCLDDGCRYRSLLVKKLHLKTPPPSGYINRCRRFRNIEV